MSKKNISADTLFHFTSKKDFLIGILRNGFYPRFCIEDRSILSGEDSILANEIAIPMICFCDIQLSQILNHVDSYGCYAIGMKKEWGIEKGITPVLYAHSNSLTTRYLKGIRNKYRNNELDEKDEEVFYPLIDLLKFCKPYDGIIVRNGNKSKVRFYDEKEWRYGPSEKIRKEKKEGQSHLRSALYKEEYFKEGRVDRDFINKENANIEQFKIDFVPEDIKYIIVEREDERYEMAKSIISIKSKFSREDVQTLTTRITSVEQIRNDF